MKTKVSIQVEGLNCEKLVNNLSGRQGVSLSVNREGKKSFTLTVGEQDSRKVVDYLIEKCYNIKQVRRHGGKSLLSNCLGHAVICVAVVLLAVVVFLGERVCLIRKIEAPDPVFIAECLDEYGLKFGTSLQDVSLDEVENYLATRTPEAMYVVADIIGSTLTIKVIENTRVSQPVDYTQPCDVVALRDGVVSNIIVISGTPLVGIGDTVKKGQTLVAGYTTYKDGTTKPIRAVAEVYAEVSSVYSTELSERVADYTPTGNSYTYSLIKVADCHVYGERGDNYRYFEEISTVYRLFPLNITVTSYKVIELKEVIRTVPIEQQLAALKQAALLQALQNIDFTPQYAEYIIDEKLTAVVYGEVLITEGFGG